MGVARPLSRRDSVSKDLGRQLAQEFRLVALGQLLEDGIDALAAGVADRAETVARHGAGDGAGEISHDEAHGTAAEAADEAPELACRPRLGSLGHALLAQHLLEHRRELVVGGRRPRGILWSLLLLLTKAKGGEGERREEGRGCVLLLLLLILWLLMLLLLLLCAPTEEVLVALRPRAGAKPLICPRRIIVPPARGIG